MIYMLLFLQGYSNDERWQPFRFEKIGVKKVSEFQKERSPKRQSCETAKAGEFIGRQGVVSNCLMVDTLAIVNGTLRPACR